MQQERLHIQEPERDGEHRADCQSEECSCSPVAESGENSETKHAEVGERAEQCQRNSANPRIRAAEYTKTIQRSSADQCFSSQCLHAEVSCICKPYQRYDGENRVKNGTRQGHRVMICSSGPLLSSLVDRLAFYSSGQPLGC